MEKQLDRRTERRVRGVVGWVLDRLHPTARPRPLLAIVERIALAPRQSLVLVEAGGRRLLVATVPDRTPAFYPLDEPGTQIPGKHHQGCAIELEGSVC